jgi:hypothetical protein
LSSNYNGIVFYVVYFVNSGTFDVLEISQKHNVIAGNNEEGFIWRAGKQNGSPGALSALQKKPVELSRFAGAGLFGI